MPNKYFAFPALAYMCVGGVCACVLTNSVRRNLSTFTRDAKPFTKKSMSPGHSASRKRLWVHEAEYKGSSELGFLDGQLTIFLAAPCVSTTATLREVNIFHVLHRRERTAVLFLESTSHHKVTLHFVVCVNGCNVKITCI